MRLYENKGHSERCALRVISPETIRAWRRSYRDSEGGEPPHCTCLKPNLALRRLNRLLEAKAANVPSEER